MSDQPIDSMLCGNVISLNWDSGAGGLRIIRRVDTLSSQSSEGGTISLAHFLGRQASQSLRSGQGQLQQVVPIQINLLMSRPKDEVCKMQILAGGSTEDQNDTKIILRIAPLHHHVKAPSVENVPITAPAIVPTVASPVVTPAEIPATPPAIPPVVPPREEQNQHSQPYKNDEKATQNASKHIKPLVELAKDLSEEELVERAIEQLIRNNSRIRQSKNKTKAIVKAIQRNRTASSIRSSFPSSEYPFLVEDSSGRLYYCHNGGQSIQSGSIEQFIKRNLTEEKSGYFAELNRFHSDYSSRRRRRD